MPTRIHVTTESLQQSAANWDSTYVTVCCLSALWEETADIVPTVTNYLSTNIVSLCALTVTDLQVLSSLTVLGTATFLETQSIVINDPIFYVAEGNAADILDIGLAGTWTSAPVGTQYGGLVRRADTKFWTLFSGITSSPLSGINLDWTQPGVKIDSLSANFYGDIYGNRNVYGSFNIENGLTVINNISGNNLRTSFNQGSATGNFSFAINRGRSFGNFSYSEGINATASGESSHAEGFNTVASDYASHVEGVSSIASGFSSHAEGNTTTASGSASHAEGGFTIASGDFSHAEGNTTTASGSASHAEGFFTIASQIHSHAEGNTTTASGSASHAEGLSTLASGDFSHAEGEFTVASGESSHAEGNTTTASGLHSHAEGENTVASGPYSHAEGTGTLAQGPGSHAEGTSTRATGSDSHAEGNQTIASGAHSHAEGQFSEARRVGTHAAGIRGTAAHNYSYIWSNDSTLTQNISTTRTNQYMISASNGVFIPGRVGIGTDFPNSPLTVAGVIAAQGGNSDLWNQAYTLATNFQGASGSYATESVVRSVSSLLLLTSTYQAASSVWQSTFNTVCALSASWEESAEILPTITNFLSTNNTSLCSIDVRGSLLSAGTSLFNIFLTKETDSQTLTYTESSYNLSITSGNSINLSSINTVVATNSANWQSTYFTVCALSASWEESADIIPTVTNHLSTNAITLCSIDVRGSLLSAGVNLFGLFTTTFAINSAIYILDGGNTPTTTLSVGTKNAQDLEILTNNVSRISILSAGRVGINTTLPNQALTVMGNISTNGAFLGSAQDSVLNISSTNTVQNSTIALAISSINTNLQILVPPPTYLPPVATLTNFNPNTFEFGANVSRSLILGFTQNEAGSPTLFESFKNNTPLLTQILPFTEIVNEAAALGTTTYKNTVTYQQGPIKNNILNLPDERDRIAAGSVSINQTYTAHYRRWIGSVPTFLSSPNNVRTLSLSTSLDTNNILASQTSPIYINNKFIIIAIPNTRVLTTVITENNENLTSQFNLSSTQIQNAGGVDQSYKLYYLETALPLNANLTNVTIANV